MLFYDAHSAQRPLVFTPHHKDYFSDDFMYTIFIISGQVTNSNTNSKFMIMYAMQANNLRTFSL